MGYAAVAGVKWIVITNGDEYRIYNACVDVPVEEKLFRSVRLSDPISPVLETLALLSKDRIRENEMEVLWKTHFVDRQVRAALDDLFSPEPDPSLLRLVVKRVSELPSKDIRASLLRVRAQFDFPVELDSRPTGQRNILRKSTKYAGVVSGKKRGTPKMLGVKLIDLIQAGLLKPPVKLVSRYKGQQIEATLLADGRVDFQGTKYKSCSKAGGAAIQAASGRDVASTDGWKFWLCRDEAGNLVQLHAIRQKYLKQKAN